MGATHLPETLRINAVEFATIMRNAFINSTNQVSPRWKAGLACLIATSVFTLRQFICISYVLVPLQIVETQKKNVIK